MPELNPIAGDLILLCLCAVCALTDLRSGEIPNRLTLGGLAAGAFLGLVGGGAHGLLGAVAGASVVGIGPAILFYRGAMGGGDVKLFLAIGALCGGSAGLRLQLAAFSLGALYGIFVWLRRRILLRQLRLALAFCLPFRTDASSQIAEETRIRFAPCIFAAAVMLVVSGRFS